MAQHCHQITFSPVDSASSLKHLQQPLHGPHSSLQGQVMMGTLGTESGYASSFSLSHPFESPNDSAVINTDASFGTMDASNGGMQMTPRTTAAINFMSALQLTTPRLADRSGRKGTPLKRQQSIFNRSAISETTPKKCKSNENNENDQSWLSGSAESRKMPFRVRLDHSQTMSPQSIDMCVGKLDCTFDAISSSTPISQPFRSEFYEEHVQDIPIKDYLTRSVGKKTRTKLIRKMQSFSPKKLMSMQSKLPLREMNHNCRDSPSTGLFAVEEEDSPILKESPMAVKKILFGNSSTAVGDGTVSDGLKDLMYGAIKCNGKDHQEGNSDGKHIQESGRHMSPREKEMNSETVQERQSQLLDIYVSNLSNLDNRDTNSNQSLADDGDVSMNLSMVADVERYFDELKRNTTQLQEDIPLDSFVPVSKKNSLDLYDINPPLRINSSTEAKAMEIEPIIAASSRPPMLLRKRKRPSTELIQAVLATPKKMRRSQSFHMGDFPTAQIRDENSPLLPDYSSDCSHPSLLVSPNHQLGGARKRLNYEPVIRNRSSPAKRSLGFGNGSVNPRRFLNGTQKLNIFKHLANCPPVREYFFQFVEDKDLVSIYGLNKQCKAMIEEHPKLNERRLKYLEAAWRKKENSVEVNHKSAINSTIEELVLRTHGDRSINRIPLHNRNMDLSSLNNIHGAMSPPVSPSKRKFHENQKLVQRNPGAFLVSCPRCRASSLIENFNSSPLLSQSTSSHVERIGEEKFTFQGQRSNSMCVGEFPSYLNDSPLMIPVRKQLSLPETTCFRASKDEFAEKRLAVCQSTQCGFRFCVHCSYAYEPGHTCVEIGTLSPLIKQAKQPRVVACSKQSKRNLKRL